TKEHNQRFKQPLVSDESCLFLIAFFHSNIIITVGS
ncbi:hypothetical protein JAAARDRAFT_127788, partial [Jaapia argillacea MUCL 33604]